jgi:outer membrane receptor protein involved in Fe transport
MRTLLLLCTFFITTGVWAQGTVTGSVVDNTGKPVEKASIIILNIKDSSEVKGTSAGSDGVYHFRRIAPGTYLVVASAVGKVKHYSDPFSVGEKDLTVPAIQLMPEVKSLSEVTITTQKPMVEQKIDRMVVNVDASPTNVGTTVMDVLQKTPGISVDKDGNISLKGKSGVMVMMDGKPTYLSASDLANLLKNMPSSELEQIEVMTNPPAKYDAAGNAGVINLKTKKNKARGFNGNVTVGGGYGKGPKANNSINLNYRTGKFNFFGSYNESFNRHPQTLDLSRKFRDTIGGPINSIFMQHTDMNNEYGENSFKVGTDYSMNRKTTIGVVFTGYFNPGYFDSENKTNMEDGQGNVDSVSVTNGHVKQNFQNFGVNLNFTHKFDSTGKELSGSLDYLGYDLANHQMYRTNYTTPDGVLLPPVDTLRGVLPGNIRIYTGKVDYVNPFKHDWKLETGLKASSVRTDNDAEYDNLVAGKWLVDTTKTNHFIYTEGILAAYASVSKVFNKHWTVQTGLRMETTISKGNLTTDTTTFNRNYTKLFPTAYIQYTLNDKNQFVLDYGRRIQRPDYNDLNPFKYFLDPYTYQEGNPFLKPQISNNIELTHTYHSVLTTTLNYTQVTDIIQQVLLQNDATHTTFVQQGNVARQENIGLAVNFGMPVTKWWTPNVYASLAYNDYKGVINGYPLEVFGYTLTGNMSQSFSFKHGWKAEASGWYQGKQVSGTMIANPMGAINFGVSKQVLKDAGTVRLNLQDPFNLAHFSGYSRYGNVDVTIVNHWDNRVVNLSFTYRFGKNQQNIREHRQSSSADEESSRVKH